MSIRTIKGVVWIAVAMAVAMIFAIASPSFDRNESLALFIGACAVLVVVILWYRRVMPAAEAREEEERAAQVAALKQQVALAGQPVEVRASTGMPLLVLMLSIAAATGYAAFTTPGLESKAMFAAAIVLAVFVACFSIPALGKPALVIQRDGLSTAVMGAFGWEEIESIGLRSQSNNGATSHSLHIGVPRLHERESSLSFLSRMRTRMTRGAERNFVVVLLTFPSHPATVVHALCHALWKERTGRTSLATSAPSQALIEMKRCADEQFAALERAGELAKTDPEEAMKLLDELKQKFPPQQPPPRRPLAAGRKAKVDALMAEISTVDPRDEVARKKVVDRHVKAEVRRGTTMAMILIIVGFALVMTVAVLWNG